MVERKIYFFYDIFCNFICEIKNKNIDLQRIINKHIYKMNLIGNIKELTKDGNYKYRGFLLKKDAIFGGSGEFEKVEGTDEEIEVQEIKEIGEQYSFFADKDDNVFFVINTKINKVSFNVPLGEFQSKAGSFNASHNVTIENGFYFFDKKEDETIEEIV